MNHPILTAAFNWFNCITYEPQRTASAYLLDKIDEQYHPELRELLRFADLGISDYRLREIRKPGMGSAGLLDIPGEEVEILHGATGQDAVAFPLTQESNGTRQILYLGQRILAVLERGGLLAVDELDASIHPLLVRAIIELFHNPGINRAGAQLIFNTHDTTLLDPTFFRRDQVWFTEKDVHGAAHLYALLEYSPRKGESLSKGYLQGRYGAIPFLGDPSMIFDKELCE